jgi:hypothetical protein
LNALLIRLLDGALSSITLPPGIPRPRVLSKMPVSGWGALPFITVNLDLIQQSEVALGESIENPTQDNIWSLFANARRTWRVTVMCASAEERDFFRDTLLVVFRVLKATAFSPLGLNVTHSFMARSYSSVVEWAGQTPGFYGSDLMLTIDGIFPTAVVTDYAVIREVQATMIENQFNFVMQTEP